MPYKINPLFYSHHMNGFEQQWNEYRKRRNLFLLTVLGYVPIEYASTFLRSRVLQIRTLFFVFTLIWLSFIVVAAL
jgi:hypothetical protein